MLTQCPHCATVFPIESEHYLSANGRVRCGVCEQEFDALERLHRDPVPTLQPAQLDPEFIARQGDLFRAAAAAQPSALPDFLQPSAGPAPGALRWWLGAALLAGLLGLQIVLAERHRLALDPQWRPLLGTLCAAFRCSLPQAHDPRRWSLIARDISPHPSTGDALLVTATVRNDADWPQTLPWLELALADIDGQPMALRRFAPGEYFEGYDGRALAPGQTAAVRLELADPGKTALAFAFEFR